MPVYKVCVSTSLQPSRQLQVSLLQENVVAFDSQGITASIKSFLMLVDDFRHRDPEIYLCEEVSPDNWMFLYHFELKYVELSWFVRYFRADLNLSHIVNHCCKTKCFLPILFDRQFL